jgi:prepilin-type N-terminal cleavage/methylation domain-containing protein
VKRESGFTLLEVLIALTIMAVGVALALSVISGSLGNIRKVRANTRLIDRAQSVMELALLDEKIVGAATLNGDYEDGTRWNVVITQVEMPPPTTPLPVGIPQAMQQMPLVLSYVVSIMEPNSTTPQFQLQTLKLINPPNPIQGGTPRVVK